MYRESDANAIARMEPMLTKKFAEFADEVERTVPPSGKFKPLFALFEDETKSLDMVNWSLVVCDLIYANCSEKVLSTRYLELRGYPGGAYCTTRIVGSGSVKECAELLRSQAFVANVMEAMKALLRICDDI